MGGKSSIFKPDNVATKSVPSSGRSSLTSTESTQPAPTTETPTSSWRGSTCTTMRPQEANTCPGPSWSTWSQAPWTLSAPDLSDRSSDQTTSSLDNLVPATTGPRDTTQKVPSSSTPSSMSSERKLRDSIASRDSSSHTPSVVAPDPEWEPSSSPRSVRNTPTGGG